MKEFALLLLVTLSLVSSAGAKKAKYGLVATMTYHAAKLSNLLDGRTDLYYSGAYTCTPGSEHYAPDCRLQKDWFVVDAISFDDVVLEDGSEIVVSSAPFECGLAPSDCRKRELWDHDKVKYVVGVGEISNPFWQVSVAWGPVDNGDQLTILYRVKKDGGIEIWPGTLELAKAKRALQH